MQTTVLPFILDSDSRQAPTERNASDLGIAYLVRAVVETMEADVAGKVTDSNGKYGGRMNSPNAVPRSMPPLHRTVHIEPRTRSDAT